MRRRATVVTVDCWPRPNYAVHTEDGIARLQMENRLAVPGDSYR